MKTRVLFVLLAFLLVGGMAFAKPGSEAVPKPTPAASGEPKYGGRLTIMNHTAANEPDSPDIKDGMYAHLYWLSAIQECAVEGDLEKYGPRGNNEFAFQSRGYIPWKYLRGCLIESWETTTTKMTWHVRKGVYWAGRDVMPNRELVAEDIRADLQYLYDSPTSTRWKPYISKIYTTDKYTVVLDYAQFSPFVMYYIGYEDRALTSPPETQGSKKYDNQVGTGPFMFKEYAPGSYMSYVKNPNYWKTTTINGKKYKLPFVDELRCLIIVDQATAVAALRTAKVDLYQLTPFTEWESLKKTSPELKTTKYTFGGNVACLKCTEPPFNNPDVRRAMFVGTDFQAIHDLVGLPKDMPLHWYPYLITDPTMYVPLEKLPARDQLLFKYDPTLAKKMLADAGYPNGFKTQYVAPVGGNNQDLAEMLKFQWAKIGVDLEIKMVDSTTDITMIRGRTYTGAAFAGYDVVSPSNTIIDYGMKDKLNNYAGWSDPKYEEIANKVATVVDETERVALMKQALQMLFEGYATLPLYPTIGGHFYWPWMQNYYGELTITDGAIEPVMAYVWLDQDMKKKMGF